KHLQTLATMCTLALVIDAEKIKVRAAKRKLHIFVAKQLHATLRKELLGGVFGAGINFMVAVAPENAEGCAKSANFLDAIGQRVRGSSDEISGDDGDIGTQIVGHVHRAAHIRTAHAATEVNVAKLDDFQAVESGRQIGSGDFDAADAIIQALGGETIDHAEERYSASQSGGGAEEVAARRVGEQCGSLSRGACCRRRV